MRSMRRSNFMLFATGVILSILLLTTALPILWISRSGFSAETAKNGDFAVGAVWTDIGAWGYSGRICLIDKRGFLPRLYDTGQSVPAIYGWETDTVFYIQNRQAERLYFAVGDFVHE